MLAAHELQQDNDVVYSVDDHEEQHEHLTANKEQNTLTVTKYMHSNSTHTYQPN